MHSQVRTSHRCFTPSNEPPQQDPPDDSIQTKSEEIPEQVVKTMGISHLPDIPKVDTTPIHWNPLTSINEDTQRHKAQGIRNGTAIAFSNGSFKYSWVTSALFIEGGRNNVHRITATSTIPGRSKYQEA